MVDFTLLQMHSNWKLFSKFECRRSSLKKGKLVFCEAPAHWRAAQSAYDAVREQSKRVLLKYS